MRISFFLACVTLGAAATAGAAETAGTCGLTLRLVDADTKALRPGLVRFKDADGKPVKDAEWPIVHWEAV